MGRLAKPGKTIAMLHTNKIDGAVIQQWISARLEPSAVEKELVAKGLGAFTGFISCVLSIINPVPELYNVFLFGLTSVAVLIVFAGLYFLFE